MSTGLESALQGEKPPRVLLLTCHLPYPAISGGRRRELELLTRLGRVCEIELYVASKTFEEDRANAPILEEHCAEVRVYGCNPMGASGRLPLQVRRHLCPDLSVAVSERLARGDIDVVHVEGFYMEQHVPRGVETPVLLVDQNVEYALWHQRAELAPTKRLKRTYFAEYLRTLEAEIAAWRRSSICAAVTEEDRALMLDADRSVNVRVVPDGADHIALPSNPASPVQRASHPVVAFVANFGYEPNVDAAIYLADSIWPRVSRQLPDAELWLVGNAPPAEVCALQERGIVVTGRVPDVEPYLRSADVVLCPLRIGGGIKVKVLESLLLGKATVTTTIGAQGLDGARDALVVADKPHQMARAVVSLITDPSERRRLEAKALSIGSKLPTWDRAAAALSECYKELSASSADLSRSVDSQAVGGGVQPRHQTSH